MGIELNLNIFETNLINLGIVLSVVFLVIVDAFKAALKSVVMLKKKQEE